MSNKSQLEMYVEDLRQEVMRLHDFIKENNKKHENEMKELKEEYNKLVRRLVIGIILLIFLVVIVGLATFDLLYWLVFINKFAIIRIII